MKIINCLFLISCFGIFTSCVSPNQESNKNIQNMEHSNEISAKEIKLVFDNPEQIDHGNLSLAIGNIWEEKNEEGDPYFTAGLWVYFKENEEKDIHHRIQEQQKIEAEDYVIRVIEIPDTETVVLGISEKE